MAEALFLVERTTMLDGNDIDGVRSVIINDVEGTSDADVITATIAALNAASGATSKFPAGYFDTVNELSDLVTAGDLRADGDFIAFPEKAYQVRS